MAKLIIEFREPQFGVEVMPCIRLDTDKPTNGDMIKAMFPEDRKQFEYAVNTDLKQVTMFVFTDNNAWFTHFDLDWWNAPFKGV